MIRRSSYVIVSYQHRYTGRSFLSSTKQILNQTPTSSEAQSRVKHIERLSKYIASSGICSRREAEKFIREGRVQVNGVVLTNVSESIDSSSSPKTVVMLDGIIVHRKAFSRPPKLWAIYKHRGELTSSQDDKNRKLLLERFLSLVKDMLSATDSSWGSDASSIISMKPVNRLDYNTEGLCLITNNGILSRALSNAEKFNRQYRVRIHGLLTSSKLDGLRRGVFMDGRRQKPMEVEIEKASSTISWIKITTTEPSNRVVYKCLQQVHLDVTRMISIAIGPINEKVLFNKGCAEVKLTPEIMKDFLNVYKMG